MRVFPLRREVAEANSIKVQFQELSKRAYCLFRLLSYSRRRGAQPPAELVLEGVSNNDDLLSRQVQSDAPRRVPWKMHNAYSVAKWH